MTQKEENELFLKLYDNLGGLCRCMRKKNRQISGGKETEDPLKLVNSIEDAMIKLYHYFKE